MGPLIRKCCTMDQGKAVVTFLDAIPDKNLRSTVALLAGCGRGKSASLGLAIAGAVAAGYSNIFVTAPTPENLKTLFEFVLKGFGMLKYMDFNRFYDSRALSSGCVDSDEIAAEMLDVSRAARRAMVWMYGLGGLQRLALLLLLVSKLEWGKDS